MHLLTSLIVVTMAVAIRQTSFHTQGWLKRWYRALFLFLFPALLLLTTAMTILYMGCHGKMLGIKAGFLGCVISGCLILFACFCLLKLAYQSNRAIAQLQNYTQSKVGQINARIIELDLPYSAQIGFWRSQLVMSQGLIATLDSEHLSAVIAHEQAHVQYRDTFWFFWLGWIRDFSFWLPNTEALWQELLLLRELRADYKAAESVDFLLLAESLLFVAKAPLNSPVGCVSFNDAQIGDRLNERIDSLLDPTESISSNKWHNWSWLCLLFLPLLTIPLHY